MFNTYYFEVEVVVNHDVSRFEVAVANFEAAVEVFEEDHQLGPVSAHQV